MPPTMNEGQKNSFTMSASFYAAVWCTQQQASLPTGLFYCELLHDKLSHICVCSHSRSSVLFLQ